MITGCSIQAGLKREYLKPNVDYTNSNSVGSRGVTLCYILETGHVYHVQHMPSWTRSEQYYCRVTDEGDIDQIEESEVLQWLKANGL